MHAPWCFLLSTPSPRSSSPYCNRWARTTQKGSWRSHPQHSEMARNLSHSELLRPKKQTNPKIGLWKASTHVPSNTLVFAGLIYSPFLCKPFPRFLCLLSYGLVQMMGDTGKDRMGESENRWVSLPPLYTHPLWFGAPAQDASSPYPSPRQEASSMNLTQSGGQLWLLGSWVLLTPTPPRLFHLQL